MKDTFYVYKWGSISCDDHTRIRALIFVQSLITCDQRTALLAATSLLRMPDPLVEIALHPNINPELRGEAQEALRGREKNVVALLVRLSTNYEPENRMYFINSLERLMSRHIFLNLHVPDQQDISLRLVRLDEVRLAAGRHVLANTNVAQFVAQRLHGKDSPYADERPDAIDHTLANEGKEILRKQGAPDAWKQHMMSTSWIVSSPTWREDYRALLQLLKRISPCALVSKIRAKRQKQRHF